MDLHNLCFSIYYAIERQKLEFHKPLDILSFIQGVFEVEVFLLTCDSMRCSKEF
jgi:hypothetical protein